MAPCVEKLLLQRPGAIALPPNPWYQRFAWYPRVIENQRIWLKFYYERWVPYPIPSPEDPVLYSLWLESIGGTFNYWGRFEHRNTRPVLLNEYFPPRGNLISLSAARLANSASKRGRIGIGAVPSGTDPSHTT